MCLRKVSVGEIGEGLKGPMKSGHSKNMLSTYIQLLKNKKKTAKNYKGIWMGEVYCKAFSETISMPLSEFLRVS